AGQAAPLVGLALRMADRVHETGGPWREAGLATRVRFPERLEDLHEVLFRLEPQHLAGLGTPDAVDAQLPHARRPVLTLLRVRHRRPPWSGRPPGRRAARPGRRPAPGAGSMRARSGPARTWRRGRRPPSRTGP